MNRLSAAWGAYRDRLLRRCFHCGEWAYDQDDCPACAAPAASHPRPVREHKPETSREYRDLLDIAHATCRAQDQHQEKTA